MNTLPIKSGSSDHDAEDCYDLRAHLERLCKCAGSWPARAAVKKNAPDTAPEFDLDKPDFLPELLPFHDHPSFLRAPEPYRQAALSCGWIAYNEKTVAIESKIVTPACMHLIDGNVADFHRDQYREAITQALVDESFHILLVVQANRVTRQRRNLEGLTIPPFSLVANMQRQQAQHPERWKNILIQLATAVVSEVLVSDYLRLLSTAEDIQPLNRITTEIHRRDEAAHNGLFKSLGAVIYHALGRREKEFFAQALMQPSPWFASPELDVWEAMLRHIKFPGARQMVNDCRTETKVRGVDLDLATLDGLFDDLGMDNRMRVLACERSLGQP